jgi:lauroyl/myristoyl acyltransferase
MVIAKSTGDRKADELRVTHELLSHIEGFIRKHPEQWHVPHRIWEGSP